MPWFTHGAKVESTGSAEQAAQLEALRRDVQDLTQDDALLRTYVSDRTLRRFLTSRGNNLEKATKALRKTLAWRKEFRPDTMTWGDLAEGRVKGGRLEILAAPDTEGRPVLLYRVPGKTLPATGHEYLKFWFYMLETLQQLADEADRQVFIVFDMAGYSDAATVLPPFWTRLEALQLAQAHYPESLGRVVVGNPTLLFWGLWKAAQPLLDPFTKSKVHFANDGPALKAALDPLLRAEDRYASLGGTRPGEAPALEQMNALMRAIDARRLARQEAARQQLQAQQQGLPKGEGQLSPADGAATVTVANGPLGAKPLRGGQGPAAAPVVASQS